MTARGIQDKITVMFYELLTQQRRYLDYYFNHIDSKQCDHVLQMALNCQGALVFTGVGKSGFIAQKIAATLMSTGTKSSFLPPVDAMHGDLGMVSKGDVIFFLSKSGETEELLQMLPFLHDRGNALIALTSNKESRLAHACNLFVELPCREELCPFGLAPTTSSEVQLMFGDVLTAALMRMKKIPLSLFVENHPAGRIGKRATLKVREFMIKKAETPLCTPSQRLQEVLCDFTHKKCGCLVVVDEDKKLKGIFTDGDLRRALQVKGENVLQEKIEDLMNKYPKSILKDALAWEAMQLMEENQNQPITVLPVLDAANEVMGLIKMHDLIQAGL